MWRRSHHKFGAQKTIVDGIVFDSKKEASRYKDLVLLQRSGEITGLEIHKAFDLHALGKKVGKIIPDFVYNERGLKIVEDVKSEATITPLFRWKAKHFEIEYGIKIRLYL